MPALYTRKIYMSTAILPSYFKDPAVAICGTYIKCVARKIALDL